MLGDVRRRLFVLLLVVTASAVVPAQAASLGLVAGHLGVGSAAVARCDDAVAATPVVAGCLVTGVSVTDLAAACGGGTLTATVTNGGVAVGAGGPVAVPVGGGAVTVPLAAPHPSSADVTDARLVVVGP